MKRIYQVSRSIRAESDLGFVFVDMEKAIKQPESKFNYVLAEGDEIIVPKDRDLVTITGAIKYPDIDSIVQISAPYIPGKKAKFYIKNYGAGFAKDAKKKWTYVESPGGYIKNVSNWGFFKAYPKVEEGSTITVLAKPEKEKRKKEKTPTDPTLAAARLTAIATVVTSSIALLILVQNALK